MNKAITAGIILLTLFFVLCYHVGNAAIEDANVGIDVGKVRIIGER